MLETHSAANPLDDLEPVTDAAEVAKLIEVVRTVHVSQAVKQYAVDLVSATRRSPDLRLGASPRATLHLVRAARAHAAAGLPHATGGDYMVEHWLAVYAVLYLTDEGIRR